MTLKESSVKVKVDCLKSGTFLHSSRSQLIDNDDNDISHFTENYSYLCSKIKFLFTKLSQTMELILVYPRVIAFKSALKTEKSGLW